MTFNTSAVAVCCCSDFGKIVRALTQFSEQSGIFDRNYCLIGESFHQGKLFVRQWPRLCAHDTQAADCNIPTHHRDARHRAVARVVKILRAEHKLRRRFTDIGNIHYLRIKNSGAVHIVARERDRKFLPPHVRTHRIIFVDCGGFDLIPVDECQAYRGIRKKIQGALHDRVENWLSICRRIADHLQNLGRCCLLLERLACFIEQPDILDRDHCLVGEAFDQRDLLRGERLELACV